MSYARYRQTFAIPLVAGRTNGAVIWSFSLQKLERITNIFGFRAYMSTAGSNAGCVINVAVNAVNLTPYVTTGNSTGYKAINLNSSYMPQTVTVTSAVRVVELVQSTTDSSGIGTFYIDMEIAR